MSIIPTTPRTISSPAATMTTLAAPSLGSTELSSWRVNMAAGSEGPVHTVNREQVWLVLSGALTITTDASTDVAAGETVVLPPHITRQITARQDAEALVCMGIGGTATVPGSDERRQLPWAE